MSTFRPAPPNAYREPEIDNTQERSYVKPRDVVYLTHEAAHAFIAPHQTQTGDVQWIDEPCHPDVTYTVSEIEYLVDSGAATILQDGVSSRAEWQTYVVPVDKSNCIDPWCVSVGGAPSVKALSLGIERGTDTKWHTNSFLKHPEINYRGEPVTNGLKVSFTANYNDHTVAMAVLGKPVAPQGWHNYRDIQLLKFAAHPQRPENTGSWLLSRAVEWTDLEAYEHFITYAGSMNDNEGTMYDATGFDLHDVEKDHDGDGWENRSGRSGTGVYTKRTWVKQLSDNHSLESRRREGRDHAISSGITEWADVSRDTPAIADLTFTREEPLSASNDEVTSFLETHGNAESVPVKDVVAVFGARHGPDLAAALVVTDPTETRRFTNNFDRVVLSDLAIDSVDYPVNVARWLVGKARRWAYLYGYQTIEAVTPQAGPGEVYAGAQFEHHASPLADGGTSQGTTTWAHELREEPVF